MIFCVVGILAVIVFIAFMEAGDPVGAFAAVTVLGFLGGILAAHFESLR